MSADASEALAVQIARQESREALRDLVSRYGYALDGRDWATAPELFTRDGALAFEGEEIKRS